MSDAYELAGTVRRAATLSMTTIPVPSSTQIPDARSPSAIALTSTRPPQLPTMYYVFSQNGTALCGGGRALVPCPPSIPAAATAPVAAVAAPPPVTRAVVLSALRRIGLPALVAHTQPKDKTLVNFATIFYAEPQAVTRDLTLLGQQVQVQASAVTYTWRYGDGSSTTTAGPGSPYPAMDVTHEYSHAHTTVATSVDVSYGARFRVGDGGWQTIPGAVTIAGPTSPLRISEATPVLSGDY